MLIQMEDLLESERITCSVNRRKKRKEKKKEKLAEQKASP